MSFLDWGGGGGGGVGTVWAYIPGDSQGVTKYYSNQYVRCWKQWRTDELVDLLCRSGGYGAQMLDKELTQIQINNI